MTSNIGAEYLLGLTENSTPDQTEAAHNQVMDRVRTSFPPEFLNRLSAIVMFNSLGEEQLEKVVMKSMKGIKRRLEKRGIKVELEKSGVKAILDASYNPSYGARPVERYLEGTVVTKLSRMLISGELSSGTIVHIEGTSNGNNDDMVTDNSPAAKKPRNGSYLRYRVEQDASYEQGNQHNDNMDMLPEIEILN